MATIYMKQRNAREWSCVRMEQRHVGGFLAWARGARFIAYSIGGVV